MGSTYVLNRPQHPSDSVSFYQKRAFLKLDGE